MELFLHVPNLKDWPMTGTKLLGLIAALAILGSTLQAQTNVGFAFDQSYFSVLGGGSIPVADFGSSNVRRSGYASMGWALGAELASKVGQNFEVGVIGLFDYHPVDDAAMGSRAQGVVQGGVGNLDSGPWLITWLMVGVGLNAELSPTSRGYGKFHVGALIAGSPEIRNFSNGSVATQSATTGTSAGFGFKLGAVVQKKYDIGLHLLEGQPSFETTIHRNGKVENTRFRQTVKAVQLMLGVMIN